MPEHEQAISINEIIQLILMLLMPWRISAKRMIHQSICTYAYMSFVEFVSLFGAMKMILLCRTNERKILHYIK